MDKKVFINKIENPKISIIIPIYNVAEYLEQCLDSIINQSFKDIEVICIDDNSTDVSTDIIERYRVKDSRISAIFKDTHVGVSEARNIGIEFARGEYIMFVDSDDYLVDGCFDYLYNKATKNDLDILMFDSYTLNCEEGHNAAILLKDKNLKNFLNEIIDGNELILKQYNVQEYYAPVWRLFVKNAHLKESNVKFIPNIIHEDEAFTALIISKSKRVMVTDEQFYVHRKRANSIMTRDFTHKNIEGHFVAYLELITYYASTGYIHLGIYFRARTIFNMCKQRYFLLPEEERKKCFSGALEIYRFMFESSILMNYKYVTERDKLILSNNKLKEELNGIKNSASFKIGRAVTFIPRKIRGGIRCYKENGLKYTVKRLFEKLLKVIN